LGDIAKGMLVQHASLGVGRVVAVEPTALHVFIPGSGKPAPPSCTGWTQAPSSSSFLLGPTERRYAMATGWITHDQAIAEFLRDLPRGFADPGYLGDERRRARAPAPHWRAAKAEWLESMRSGEGERLLALATCGSSSSAVRIEKHVALVPGTSSQAHWGLSPCTLRW